MKQIKIFFEDFGNSLDPNDNFITNILREQYEVIIDKKPDYLFFSDFGYNHLKYQDCIKIFYSGENTVPDFNLCDYAIATHHLSFDDRYLHYPQYLVYNDGLEYEKIGSEIFDREQVLNRKFCNFVYSNGKGADPIREQFFKKLSQYKKVDSGGRYLNNIGGPVLDKMAFIRNYKFTIAFENSSVSGYTTEKLVQPMAINSVPIYWGNPDVHLDFNKNSFVFVNNFDTLDAAVEEIIRLDNDDESYIKIIQNILYNDYTSKKDWSKKLLVFLQNVIEQDQTKAKRVTDYGWIVAYRKKHEIMGQVFGRKISLLRYILKTLNRFSNAKKNINFYISSCRRIR
ncbi:MAG: glycosyltransferase [Dysgonamonadaceae bacterium]|jgi:hypothetical protein|nr:glycosyltransferase [Dysgonamonadaceae bacterium]